MEAVARRAGVNRVVVYRSFANLQLLLLAMLRRGDARTRAALEAVVPSTPGDRTPTELLGNTLAAFLAAVLADPLTWRVALLRPESAPIALQKLVNRRRTQLARRLSRSSAGGSAGSPARRRNSTSSSSPGCCSPSGRSSGGSRSRIPSSRRSDCSPGSGRCSIVCRSASS